MEKLSNPILTIEEILNSYYYKEWVIEELRRIRERTSGNKNELIQRYLSSAYIRNRDAHALVKDLLSVLDKQDLKQILKDHNFNGSKSKNDMLNKIMNSFSFEPYISKVLRYCNVCLDKTNQELHLDNSWKPVYFKCTVCNSKLLANQDNKTSLNKLEIPGNWLSDIERYLKKYYWEIISLFLGVFFSTTSALKYNFILGFLVSFLAISIVIYSGFLFTTHKTQKNN
jgi:hypothetical protein